MKRKARRIARLQAELIKAYREFYRNVVESLNLMYKTGIIDKEVINRIAKKEANRLLERIREEERRVLSYIG